jgi:CBS domain-containing protein
MCLDTDILQFIKIRDIIRRRLVSVDPSATLKEVARIMNEKGVSYVFVDGNEKGILTEGDLKRIIAFDVPLTTPVREVMSKNLVTVGIDKTLWDAVVLFFKNRIRHLPVKEGDRVVDVLTINDIVYFASRIPFYFVDEIKRTNSLEELREMYSKLNRYIVEFVSRDEYVNPINMGKIISYINDEIIRKAVEFALDDVGKPPCRFSLFVTGSEGRLEQLIKTDQDNAMIYEKDEHRDYFVELGKAIHSNLLEIGFPDCKGGYTVGNDAWVKSVRDWVEEIRYWGSYLYPENILNVSIFIDMRHVYGDVSLFNVVQTFLFNLAENQLLFVGVLKDALRFKPPIGFGGRITKDKIDIKKHGISPIVMPIRALSFGYKIRAKNTVERIEELAKNGVISRELAKNLIASYTFLKRIHLVMQVEKIKKGQTSDEIDLDELPKIRAEFIKDALKFIADFHKKIEMRFL